MPGISLASFLLLPGLFAVNHAGLHPLRGSARDFSTKDGDFLFPIATNRRNEVKTG